MKNNLNVYDRDYIKADDEINLYEVLDIILKRKLLICIILIFGIILSFCTGKYYAKNIKKEKYAQDFAINYNIFNDVTLLNAENFSTVRVLSLLNDDDVISEFYTLDSLKEIYEKNKNNENDEDIEKRKFLKKILTINSSQDKQEEISLNLKQYTILAAVPVNNKKLAQDLVNKFMEIIDRKINVAFIEKIKKIGEFNESNLKNYKNELKADNENVIKYELNNLKTESVDVVMKYSNPGIYAEINKSLKFYEDSSSLESSVKFIEKKLENSDLVEKFTSVYVVETKSYSLIILLIGSLLSLFLGIFIAFTLEFVENYKKREKQ
ncbi:hypothetical protein [Fusobacterium sp. PH5-44]|uniref:hypothetical protein n=1 Tax=unclassified Fusobacterium TaxID=2648384 RepID=UPI003D1C36DD